MPNHLANENSPYLLQHADNPVNWYPWTQAALDLARSENKPIFLSIGYAACHWCHVMAHESFEDAQIAAIMNEHFINIKVDREERPDLDDIYMSAVTALTGSGGWPMSVFLTPDGKPFFGGTYFPPVRRYNMPSFREILQTIARLWQEDRSRLLNSADEITQHLLQTSQVPSAKRQIDKKSLENASLRLAQAYDWKYGGWGQSPKFPQPMAIEFLLRRASQGDKLAFDIATHALSCMAAGGMYDVLGGGFARYSTDNLWLVPHFEKMLYDNAQLARVYLYAYLMTQQENYRQICEETLDFIAREMRSPGSPGFFSSLDADSEGEEGKYYTWAIEEVCSVLARAQQSARNSPDQDWSDIFISAYNLTQEGNFEGRNILQRTINDQELAVHFGRPEKETGELLKEMRAHLLAERQKRIRPGTDDKIIVSWNALTLIAFAEAARCLKRNDYLEIARQNADFLLTELHPSDRLLRSWRGGTARHNAYLEDYAALTLALLALYQSDSDPWWFHSALQLAGEMLQHFRHPETGFFDTRVDHDPLLFRPKNIQDNATPSGNALAALALFQLAAYTGKREWRDVAEEMLASVQEICIRYPTAFSMWLCATDFALGSVQEIAILGDPQHPDFENMRTALWSRYRPNIVAAISGYPPPPNSPPLLHNRPLVNNLPTAYICQNMVCKQPITNMQDFLAATQRS